MGGLERGSRFFLRHGGGGIALQKYKFQRQILVRNIVVIVIVIMVLTAFAFGYLVRMNEKAFQEQTDIQVRGIASQIDSTLQMADEVALQLAANSYIIGAFEQITKYQGSENYFVDHAALDYQLKQFMMSYTLKSNSIGRICLLSNNRDLTFVGRAADYGYLEKDCRDEQFLQEMETYFRTPGNSRLFFVHEQDPFSVSEDPLVSATRQIQNYQLIPSRGLGYAQAQIPMRSLAQCYSILDDGVEGYLQNTKTGTILYSQNGERNLEELEEILADNARVCYRSVYHNAEVLPDYGLRVILVARNRNLVGSMMSTLMWMVLLIVCVVSVICIGQMQVIKKTTEPIVQLCDMVETLHADENLQEIPTIVSVEDNELRQLNLAFGELVKNLKLSMEKNMTSQINELQTHMFALQSQMNPHFIHNILNVISAMEGTEEADKIPEICEKLSDMIRYNTVYETNYVTIEDEIRHAENYLELMKVRYENKFQYSMVYIGEKRTCTIPKFIIQPILENSFTHGFKKKEFPWLLDVQIYLSDENWEITVRDNGYGMSEEQVKALKEELDAMKEKAVPELMQELKIGGLSIKNIFIRLFIAYGDEMIFDVQGRLREGIKITLGGSIHDTGNGSGR